jgi:hypothetical protein
MQMVCWAAALLACLLVQVSAFLLPLQHRVQHMQTFSTHLKASSSIPLMDGDGDLLLCVNFEKLDTDVFSHWIQRFPFGVVLPVQPYTLKESDNGVDLLFRR